MESDSRYPYTYSCDLLRVLAGFGDAGAKLSRSDASRLRGRISEAIGMEDEEIAKRLADYYKANEKELTEKVFPIGCGSRRWHRMENINAISREKSIPWLHEELIECDGYRLCYTNTKLTGIVARLPGGRAVPIADLMRAYRVVMPRSMRVG